MNTEKTTIKKSISLPAWLLEKARERASQEHRSLSSYIQFLIARDAEKTSEEQQVSSPA
jgi:macrodomain Ter protein organizer (MatP/YcbG family)